jgi:thiamine biosynthesis lipoprotein
MRKVEQIMGMPISVDILFCDDEKVFDSVYEYFTHIDQHFSPYKKDSELSRYQRKELPDKELSQEFKNVIKACKEAEIMTDGYFSANYSAVFDPSGYVKGYAIAEAGKLIQEQGYKTYCIGAGGDILARSESEKIWNIGLQDPHNKQNILNTISEKNIAVATSGTYERGDHIYNPKTQEPAVKFLSVSVVGPDIITADILATAIFSGGAEDLAEKRSYKVFAIKAI